MRMIDFIMCSKIAAPTGRALAEAISARQGRRCVVRFKAMPHAARWHGKCIRYGSMVEVPGECLNSAVAVSLASNKAASLAVLKGRGVAIPELFGQSAPANAAVQIVFRKSVRHEGNDNPYIVLAGQPVDVTRSARYDYCMEWITKRREYRATAMLGKAIRLQKKVPIEGQTQDMDIRSHSRGWQLRDLPVKQDGRVSSLGIKAVAALGLDFGAADIIEDMSGGLFVIEVNTAPGLTERGVRRYSHHFNLWGQNEL